MPKRVYEVETWGNRRGRPWTASEKFRAKQWREQGVNNSDIALRLGRSPGSVQKFFYEKSLSAEFLDRRRLRIADWRARQTGRASQYGVRLFKETVAPVRAPQEVLAERDHRLNMPLRSLTAFLCGDPPVGYSALDRRLSNA